MHDATRASRFVVARFVANPSPSWTLAHLLTHSLTPSLTRAKSCIHDCMRVLSGVLVTRAYRIEHVRSRPTHSPTDSQLTRDRIVNRESHVASIFKLAYSVSCLLQPRTRWQLLANSRFFFVIHDCEKDVETGTRAVIIKVRLGRACSSVVR